MTNQHFEQLGPVVNAVSKMEFIILREFSVTRSTLLNFVSKCQNLRSIRIDQPNMVYLPPIVIHMQGINESIWNKD